jgi:hypothetical protein
MRRWRERTGRDAHHPRHTGQRVLADRHADDYRDADCPGDASGRERR